MNMRQLLVQILDESAYTPLDVKLRVTTTNGPAFVGTLDSVGADFVSIMDANDRTHYIALAHVASFGEVA